MDAGTRVGAVALAVNLGLAVAKLGVGTWAGSAALVADGFNSAGDVLATGIGLVGYRFAQRPPDDSHPFGHGNAESVAALIIGGTLLATGVFISVDGVRALVAGPREAPEGLAVAVALGTAVIKEGLARYTVSVGTRLNSPSLLASAADHRADVVIAITVAAGILASRAGLPWLDPLAAVLVGLWIVRLAVPPVWSSFDVLMDAAPVGVDAEVRTIASAHPGVRGVDRARVHSLGSYYVVDLEISVDGTLSLDAAHQIAHRVEEQVLAGVAHVREVRVHVNPDLPPTAADS
jgi:cation diffusion facilitator family transporter